MEIHHRGGANTETSTTSPTAMRSDSPENPFNPETVENTSSAPVNPFASPLSSRAGSSFGQSSAINFIQPQSRFFHSRRIRKGEIEHPWKAQKDPKEKWVTIIPLVGIALGFVIAGYLVYDGLSSVVKHNYCPVLNDDFSGGLNTNIWTQEAEVGGFGNGQFEQTTTTNENVYIENGKLVIKPTLQDANLINTDNVINLFQNGGCSSTVFSNCVTSTNTTNGTIIQPAKSGRINTKKGATIKYGRVEVTAKLPAGDWLWPAIWMLPVNETYGPWPASGEIDIMESRGNNYTYPVGGNNIMSSALHWGPDPTNDAYWRTNAGHSALHTTFAATEHTFGLEWSQKYLFTYIDSKLLQVMYTNFDQYLWQRGQFPLTSSNGTRLSDPWSQTGRMNTPFDQEFYLIINVAVGGTNGWFRDGVAGKPWVDGSPRAKNDFWAARDQWYPTWQKDNGGQLTVSKVQMWQQCDGNEMK